VKNISHKIHVNNYKAGKGRVRLHCRKPRKRRRENQGVKEV